MHLLRRVGLFLGSNVPEKGTSPARRPVIARTAPSPIVVLVRARASLMRHEHVLTMKTRRRSRMKRHWTNEELAEHWILSSKELDLIGDSKTDHNLLGAACLLKYFQQEGRFP